MQEITHQPLGPSRRVHFLRVQTENEEGEHQQDGSWVVVRDGIEVIQQGWMSNRALRLTPRHAIRLAAELLLAADRAAPRTLPDWQLSDDAQP